MAFLYLFQYFLVNKHTYDCAGRLVSVTDALGGVTSYGYDLAGNMTTQTDALGRVTTYEYDIMSSRVKRTLPGGQIETYNSYDATGNLLSKTNFNGQVTSYTYHTTTDRLLTKTGPGISVSYAYDSAGRRQSMTDNSGTTTYNYDIRDRLVTKTTPLGALTYTYVGGMLSGMSSNNTNGVDITYGYDSTSRLQSVTDNRLANSTTYSYDANGSLETCLYPNDVKHTWTYNDKNRLTNLRISKTTGDITLKSFAYTLGATGNRTKVVENSGRTVDWTYDALYRLTNEAVSSSTTSPNYAASYSYDAVGNRQTRIITPTGVLPQLPDQDFTGDYDTNDRLLDAGNFSYNLNGSTTSHDGWSYTYDAENRLLTAANGTNTISYVYDGDGNRATKNANGVITRYLTDSNNPTGYVQVVEELTGAYAVVKRYAYGHDLISQTDASTGAAYYYGYDGTVSTRLLTDDSGAVAATYDYDAFGTLVYSSGSIANSYLFHGEQYDADLGQYYLRARYMSPQIGRFWTMDEFEGEQYFSQSLHKYIFTHNDSVNNSDINGKYIAQLSLLSLTFLVLEVLSPNTLIAPTLSYVDFSIDPEVKQVQKVLINEAPDYFSDWKEGVDAVAALILNRTIKWRRSIMSVLSKRNAFEGYPYESGKGRDRLDYILLIINSQSHRQKKYYFNYFKYIESKAEEVKYCMAQDPFGDLSDQHKTLYMWSMAKKYENQNPFTTDSYMYLGTKSGNYFYGDAK